MAQTKVGWRAYVATTTTTASTLLTSIYGAWNGEALGTSLDASIHRVYNGDNVNDTSGNAQNGTNVNGVTFTTGKVGNAFTFNGSNYVTLPNNSMNLTGDFSISCWVNMTSVGAAQVFLSTYQTIGGVDYGFIFRVISGFQLIVFNGSTRIDTNPSGGAISTNTWYHVVITKTSSQIKWYINGVADNVFNGTYNNMPYHPTSNVAAIGALYKWNGTDTVQFMPNGSKIDGLTVWNKVLTANEVLSLYNVGTGAEYPFSSQLLPSPNESVSANHGTLMNGCTFTTGKIGKAFTFDGVNDHITLADNSLNLTGPFSYSFWIKSSDTTNYTIIVGNIQNARAPYGFGHGYQYWLAAGKIQADFRDGNDSTNYTKTSTASVANGSWNHVVITYKYTVGNTDGAKIYINGVLDSSRNIPNSTNFYSSPMKSCIGARNLSGTASNFISLSSLDALSTWNKELTQSEITELYNSGTGKQYPNY